MSHSTLLSIIVGIGEVYAKQAIMQPAVLLRGENVVAEIQVVALVIDQPVRQIQCDSDCSAVTTATL